MLSAKDKNKDKGIQKNEKTPAPKPRVTRAVPKTIVRINGKDLDGDLPISLALTSIKGISHRTGRMFAITLERETKVPYDNKMSTVNEQNIKVLEQIIQDPVKFGIPVWALNTRKEWVSGENKHLTMNELDFELRNTFKRLGEIKSYRGLRHTWGLPVRGQRTKSTHRNKGKSVGVTKKDSKK